MGCSPENNWNVNVRYKNVSVAAEKAKTGDGKSFSLTCSGGEPCFSPGLTGWSKVQPSFKNILKMPWQVHCQVSFQRAKLKMAIQRLVRQLCKGCARACHTAFHFVINNIRAALPWSCSGCGDLRPGEFWKHSWPLQGKHSHPLAIMHC